MRSCRPEVICEEQQIAHQAGDMIPGCTGITAQSARSVYDNVQLCLSHTECLKQVPAETVRNLGRMGQGLVEGAWNQAKTAWGLLTNTGETLSNAKRGAIEATRRLQCLNDQYKYRLTCELAGGIFGAMSVGGAVAKVGVSRAAGSGAVDRLSTRTSVVAEREAAGRGVRPAAVTRARTAARTATTGLAVQAAAKPAASNEAAAATRQSAAATARTQTALAEERRSDYLRRLLGRQNTTVEQRRAFAELAARTTSDGRTVFVDFQNSKMKYLNDHLGNKNVVTAVTNRRLELTFDRLKELKAKYPTLEDLSYDDFKSGRMAARFTDGKVPQGFTDDVSRIMAETEDEFIAELGRLGLVPEGSDLLPPEKWFAAGTGRTADQANAATRYAARTGRTSVDFWDPVVRKNLEGRLAQTDTYRAGMMTALRGTPLAERLPNGEYIPSADVFEAYRKAADPTEFGKAIKERTGETITAQSAQNLHRYLSMLDEWSTGLLIVEERQAVTFAGSKFNGVTIDISGMGALNMRELSRSLVGERNIDQALVKAREAERSATEVFGRNKAAIVDSTRASLQARGIEADIRVSGDDIIVLPKNRALDDDALGALHDAVAKSSSTSNVRISAVTENAAKADLLAVRGETLEKKVRSSTLTTVPDQSRYTLMVVSDSQGVPRLKVAARTGEVSPDVEKAFQDAFARSLAP